MARKPIAPVPPVAPELPDVDASPSRRAQYRSDRAAYQARCRMYETDKRRFDREMAEYTASIAAGQPDEPQMLVAETVPAVEQPPAPEPTWTDIEQAAVAHQPPSAPITLTPEVAAMLSTMQQQLEAQQAKIDELSQQPINPEVPTNDLPAMFRRAEEAEPAPAAPVSTTDEQIRYELAMQASNGSAYAQSLFAEEAEHRGMTVDQLSRVIIDERQLREQAVARAFAEQAKQEVGGQ